jgi:hypothetical protein
MHEQKKVSGDRAGSFLLFAFLFCLISAAAGLAQELGTIVGTVLDPSGQAVPSAQITLTEAGTGLTRTAVTNTAGGFVLPSVRPGRYTLAAGAKGFRESLQQGIVLQASQSVTVNVQLELGATLQAITVQAETAHVDTSSSSLSQVVDQQRAVELPLNGRNAASLTLLVAGAVTAPGDGSGSFGTPETVLVSSGGSLSNRTNYQLDGGSNNDTLTNVNMPFPFPDALQEFSVQTSNYTAQYGESAGGMVNIVTKSGTNELHGDLFEFLRNAVFNSRNFFASQRDPLKRNQFGGTIGGPVIIPGLYNGRERTFFFFGYQGTRVSEVQNGLTAFLPTPAMMNGDFSALLSASNPGNPLGRVLQLKDPVTGAPVPGNLLSKSEFDPAAVTMMTKFMPLNTEAANGEVFYNKPASTTGTEYIARVDHSFGAKNTLTVREFYDGNYGVPSYQPGNLITLAIKTGFVTNNVLIHETHIFRPNLVNDFRASYSRTATTQTPPSGMPNVRDFGVNIAYQPVPKAINAFQVTGFFQLQGSSSVSIPRNNFNYSDDVSLVHGRHSIAFGGSFQRMQDDIGNPLGQTGSYAFNGMFTGTAIADLLAGKLAMFNQGVGQFYSGRNSFIGVYAQDSFRATRNLTLNIGLRYEPYFPWSDTRGRIETFSLSQYLAGVHSKIFTNAPTGELFPGDAGVPKNGVTGNYRDFAPRLGFAYALGSKTSVRGGAGMFYDSATTGATLFPMASQNPWAPVTSLAPPPGPFSNPLQGLPSPLPAVFPPPANYQFPIFPAVSTFDTARHFIIPVVYNWNLMVERQITGSALVRTAYVGHESNHTGEQVNLNPAVYIPNSPLPINNRRLLPGIGNVLQDSQSINGSYNSLQVTFEKRLTHGLSVLANYTYSKSLDDLVATPWVITGVGGGTSSPIPWYTPGRHQFDYGPSDFDHKHLLVVSYVWQLPKLKGQNTAVRRILEDWEWSGIFSGNSGGPLTIVAAGGPSQTGLGGERGVIVGNAYGSGACGAAAPCVNDLVPSSFQVPAVGGFGNLGKGALRGPNFLNWDMGIFKTIPFHERLQLQFRAEFFNTFNRVNFMNPQNTVGGAGFGAILAARDPRISQLALKLTF